MASPTITYDSFSLTRSLDASTSYFCRIKDIYNAPQASIQRETSVTRHGSKVLNRYFTNKIIELTGSITTSSAANLQTAIDDLQKALLTTEGNLDIVYNTATRRYICTPDSLQFLANGHNAQTIDFTVNFVSSFPFAKGLINDSFDEVGIVTTQNSYAYIYNGTAPLRPIFTITVVSETDMTQIELAHTNKSTSIIIGANVIIAAGDVFVIDSLSGNITQNGNNIEFTGVFPEYLPGSQTTQLIIIDSGVFEVDLEIISTPYYL